MVTAWRVFRAMWVLLILLGAMALAADRAAAQVSARQTTITVAYTETTWWLLRWSNNEIVCTFTSDHDGLPTGKEIAYSCGDLVYAEWQQTPPCNELTRGNAGLCPGLYLFKISSEQKQKEITISLPPATAWVNLEGCELKPPKNLCPLLPSLVITGEEPLPNEKIVAVSGVFDGQPFSCEGDVCVLPLKVTPENGVKAEFWVNSSFGDASLVFSAQVRVLDTGVSPSPGQGGYYVDVLSSQWRGEPYPTCVQSWGAFPPAGTAPAWLTSPQDAKLLSSDEPLYYLAGRLIAQGIVDPVGCSTGGLLANGYADACGLEAARPLVEKWQNQFDARILEVANQTGVPAQLMKNLFAQESQFWPGMFRVPYEFGFGQITDNGADTLLLWNPSFYEQFCPLVLAEDTCSKGYLHLSRDESAMLRGALALQAKTDCMDCPIGVDLSNAEFSVSLFARTLQASCDQVTQIVFNATGESPGVVSTYADLWRFTIANYHAGPGCLSYAVYSAWNANRLRLLWDEVTAYFTEPCKGVVPYVEKVTR